MSTEQENIVDTNEENLDAFSEEFFGRNIPEPEPTNSEAEDEPSEVTNAPEDEDTHDDGDDDTPAPDNEDETDEVDEEVDEPAPKPKKNRFQERIDELNGKYREEERQRKALEARLAALENPVPAKTEEPTSNKVPTPDDKNEDGTDKYPLGDLDPNYIRDSMKAMFEAELAKTREAQEKEVQQREEDAARAALQVEWNSKLEPARERYPDFNEKGQEMISSLGDLDTAYGEYLAATLMAMENGSDVLYYLATHPDEAKAIVDSGATKATIALGRLEAQFMANEEPQPKVRPKVSSAPPPPKHVNKGSSVSTPEVADDTDDLDAFAAKLFKR